MMIEDQVKSFKLDKDLQEKSCFTALQLLQVLHP